MYVNISYRAQEHLLLLINISTVMLLESSNYAACTCTYVHVHSCTCTYVHECNTKIIIQCTCIYTWIRLSRKLLFRKNFRPCLEFRYFSALLTLLVHFNIHVHIHTVHASICYMYMYLYVLTSIL